MGAWSSSYFGNDTAMDLLIDLETQTLNECRETFTQIARSYIEYDKRREKGLNVVIRTSEKAALLINMCSPPLTGEMAEMVNSGIGKPDEDAGDEEAYKLIASAAVMLAARSGRVAGLPEEAGKLPLEGLSTEHTLALEIAKALALLPQNRVLSRECGPVWKKNVAKLIRELSDSVNIEA